MTYCLGMLLDAGLIMIADTRTNAGVDDISSYRKLHCLADAPDRCIYAASAGNLSTTQTVIGLLREGVPSGERRGAACGRSPSRPACSAPRNWSARRCSSPTRRSARRSPRSRSAAPPRCCSAAGSATRPPALFLIYPAGNFIECKPDVPFFQIGETKYGRPILDRTLHPSTSLAEAMKIGFLSFDSSIRSNLAVARPLDLMVMPAAPGSHSC